MKEFHHKHSTEKEYNLTHISVDTLISGLVLETSDFQKKVYVMSWRRGFNAFLGIVGNVRSKYFFFYTWKHFSRCEFGVSPPLTVKVMNLRMCSLLLSPGRNSQQSCSASLFWLAEENKWFVVFENGKVIILTVNHYLPDYKLQHRSHTEFMFLDCSALHLNCNITFVCRRYL